MSATAWSSRDLRTAVKLFLVAGLLYGVGTWWGLPNATAEPHVQSWGVDDEAPLGPLAEVRGIFLPAPDANYGYPLAHPLLTAAAYAPYMTYVVATGGLGSPTQEYPYGLRDPVRTLKVLTLIAHGLSAVLGGLCVAGIFVAVRAFTTDATAVLAAALAAVTYPMAYYARTGNVDMAVLTFSVWAVACYAWIAARSARIPLLCLLAVFSALALATKESVGGLVAVAVLGSLAAAMRASRPVGTRVIAWTAALGLLTYGVFSGLLLDPARYLDHILFLTGRVQTLATGTALPTGTFDRSIAGHLGYVALYVRYTAEAMTWPGLVLALVGVGWALVTKHPSRLLFWPAFAYAAFMFVVVRSLQLRYVLPSAVLLAPFVALLAARLWRVATGWTTAAAIAMVVAVGGTNALRSIDLTHAMLFDSRYEAADWLASQLTEGDTLEFFGSGQKLPPLPTGVVVERSTPFFGMYGDPDTSEAKADELLGRWAADPPKLVVVMPDHTSRPGEPIDNTVPPVLWERLQSGEAPLRPVASFRTPSLLPWVGRPPLDYQTVNPPIAIFGPRDGA